MLSEQVISELAAEAGFDFCAVSPVEQLPDEAYLRARIEAGHLADMKWFEQGLAHRLDIRQWMPDAQSVITVGLSYFTEHPPPEVWDSPSRGRIARYAWGPDYHDTVASALHQLAKRLQSLAGPALRWHACVDSCPLLERKYAASARLGFITRNTMFVHPRFGPYVLLGELLVSARLEPFGPFSTMDGDPCRSCRACMEICPTHALVADYTLDARRCVAYHTVENRQAIPPEIRRNMGRWIFGCDECLQVCSYTIQLSQPGRSRFWRFEADRCAPVLAEVLCWSESDFRERYIGTPVTRIGWRRFLRNALVAAGCSGNKDLTDSIARHAQARDPLLSEHAKWALAQLLRGPTNEP